MANPHFITTAYPSGDYPSTLPRSAEVPDFAYGDIVEYQRIAVNPTLAALTASIQPTPEELARLHDIITNINIKEE